MKKSLKKVLIQMTLVLLILFSTTACNSIKLRSWVFVEDGIKNAKGDIIHYDELKQLQEHICFSKEDVKGYASQCKKYKDYYERNNE
jgi:hypothetical protein